MGKFQKGHPYYFSIEGIKTGAEKRRGISRPIEVIEKVWLGNLGKKRSQETKDKLSIAKTGIKQSKDSIQKRIKSRAGYRHSQETIEKIKISNKKRFENHEYKTDESTIARKKSQYKDWRKSVYARDDYTCQKCLCRGKDLHPHHIMNFKAHPELRYEVSNGITLCVEHHKKFHKLYGKVRNNENQIENYIFGFDFTESLRCK